MMLKWCLIFLLFPCLLFSQELKELNINHDGQNRSCYVYVPQSYDQDVPAALVLNFHGYGSNATEQLNYGDFRPIADTAGFIIVLPQGSLLDGRPHFNVGGWTNASTADDVDFTVEMIDKISSSYNIDSTRIYSTGMSNGGYMSFLLACQLSDKIAAIASVTGSMTPETFSDCNPERPIPVIQMHGTRDNVVPYEGADWTKSIDDVIEYWVMHNNCNEDPVFKAIEDIRSDDGSNAEAYQYSNEESDIQVLHFRIVNGGHTWPGTNSSSLGVNQDIDASQEIWNFFSLYDINGLRDLTSNVDDEAKLDSEISIYPNPAQGSVYIQSDIGKVSGRVYDIHGALIQSFSLEKSKQINLQDGLYFISISSGNERIVKKIIVR